MLWSVVLSLSPLLDKNNNSGGSPHWTHQLWSASNSQGRMQETTSCLFWDCLRVLSIVSCVPQCWDFYPTQCVSTQETILRTFKHQTKNVWEKRKGTHHKSPTNLWIPKLGQFGSKNFEEKNNTNREVNKNRCKNIIMSFVTGLFEKLQTQHSGALGKVCKLFI